MAVHCGPGVSLEGLVQRRVALWKGDEHLVAPFGWTMQDEVEVVPCALNEGMNLARLDDNHIAGTKRDPDVINDNDAAAPGDKVHLPQTLVVVRLVDALGREAYGGQGRVS